MKRLKKYLEDHSISQVEFARTMEVSQPTVWGWLSGESLPSAKTLKKMASKTGLTIDELLDQPASKAVAS